MVPLRAAAAGAGLAAAGAGLAAGMAAGEGDGLGLGLGLGLGEGEGLAAGFAVGAAVGLAAGAAHPAPTRARDMSADKAKRQYVAFDECVRVPCTAGVTLSMDQYLLANLQDKRRQLSGTALRRGAPWRSQRHSVNQHDSSTASRKGQERRPGVTRRGKPRPAVVCCLRGRVDRRAGAVWSWASTLDGAPRTR